MNKSLMTRLASLLSRRQLKERLSRVAMVLSCAAVFCVTYMLVAPVLTQEWPTVCGLEEHTHTDECYTVELREIPAEDIPEGIQTSEGHTHTDDCYEETVERKLVCTLEESEGHTHDASCEETTRTLVCDEAESKGHHHSSSCYETEEVLVCTDDSEDHEHDSGCYENEETLVCDEEESEGHTHSDSCYEEETVYTCGQEETEGHTHDDSCYEEISTRELICGLEETPEAGEPAETGTEPRYEEVRVLTCGKEEHTHEDSCYQQETNEARYLCGLDEHTHTDSCYFESGDLRCTIPEHTHTEECLVRPTQLPEIADELVCGLDEHTHTDECYTLDEATGELVLTCEKTEHTHTDECLSQALPETDPEAVELNETFTAESEDGAVILTLQVNGLVHLPEAEESEAAGETDAIDETDVIDETQETGFRLVLAESENWDAYDEYTELAAEEGEVLVMGVLDYTLTYNGRSVDLSECETAVEVVPTEAFQQFMDAPETMGLMTMSVTEESGETEVAAEDVETCFTAYTERQGTVAYALTRGANPIFTVQYYANLERAVKEDYGKKSLENSANEIALGVAKKLPIINTDSGSTAVNSNLGGKLPKNGSVGAGQRYTSPNDNNIATLSLTEDGSIKTAQQMTEIYQEEQFEYQRAPGLRYFNIVLSNQKSQYTLKQIWVLKPGCSSDSINANDFIVYDYKDSIRFTNRPETAQDNPEDYILINSGSVIRLVYDPKNVTETLPANFYDYDISDGMIYKTAADASNGTNGQKTSSQTDATWYIRTKEQGINHPDNYEANGKVKLGFGNANAGSGMDTQNWNGYPLNKANGDSFILSSFGLVKGLDQDGNLIYDDKIVAPDLFNGESATGKTSYDNGQYALSFDRVGDTYTLKGVDNTSASTLDKFTSLKVEASWIPGGVKYIHTNNFWPMDSAPSWGTDGHDMKFGDKSKSNNRQQASGGLPESDDKKDHNAYFGMQYAVTFDLSASYVGPLEYYFFGDDDMWVFLDGKLVCDIGGVHSSVGEYVNLWDHIDRGELLDENGQPKKVPLLDADGNPVLSKDKNDNFIQAKDENGNLLFNEDGTPQYEIEMTDYVRTYTLSFFYTERGASGSTCWMQFTLPTVVGINLDSVLDEQVAAGTGSLSVEKRLDGVENTDWFKFKISGLDDNYRPDYLLRDANGNLVPNDAIREDPNYNVGNDIIGGESSFSIRAGDVLVLRGLPERAKVIVTEIERDGYHTDIKVDGDLVESQETTGEITIQAGHRSQVIFTNVSSYELPATGGSGTTIWYTMGVLSLLGAAFLMYKQLTKKEDEICA